MTTEERRVQLVTEVDTSGARAGFDEVSQQAGQMAGNVTRSGERAERAVNGIGNGASRGARNVQAAERNIVNSIQRTTAQMESGSRTSAQYYEVLARQRGVNPNVLRPYLDQLRSVEAAQLRAAQSAGQSAGQIRAAMSQVPAQMTDILVSLQGGQNALTVALQQGGQLRDSFGGIIPAAKALGGQLLGLVNPYTVAAAAAAGLAYAYAKGSGEARAYNLAIATTGNAAGTSANQLADAAVQVAKFTGSQNEAAQVIASMAATGKISGADMAALTLVAIKAQRDLGREVGVTVSEFEALGKAPVAGLIDLNAKYNHVTAATFAQVKALYDQGRATEAASLAQKAHAEGVASQTAQVVENLGLIERGWKGIKREIGEVVSAGANFFLDIGRKDTNQQVLDRLLTSQARINKNINLATEREDGWGLRKQNALLEKNKEEVKAAEGRIKAEKEQSAAAAIKAERQQLEIRLANEADKLLSREEQRTRAIARAKAEAKRLDLNDAATKTSLDLVRKEYSDVDEAARKKQEEAAKRAAELLKKEAAAIAEMSGLLPTFADDWKFLGEMYAKGVISLSMLEKEQAALLAKQPAMKAAAEAEIADRKSLAEAAEQYAKALEVTAAGKSRAVSDLQAQREENAQIGLGAAALAELNAERLEDLALRAEQKIMMAEGLDISGKMAQDLRDEAAALRERAAAVRVGSVKQITFDTNKKALDDLNQFLDPARAQDFGEALREAFGTAGDSLSRLTASLDGFGRRQAEIAEQRANAEALRGTKGFDEVRYLQTIADLNERETKNRLAGYGAMTGAAAGFFGEQSRGYKALQNASQVFHAAELAMTLAELVPKGISAVLSQGTGGDPYSAFGRMAAMAAIVTGLGVAIGSVGGGGPNMSEERQKMQGTGSVLGSDAKSESIARALDKIESATLQGLGISNGMLTSLRNIEAGIEQFASLLVRTTGVTGDFGSDMSKNVFDSTAIGIGGAAGGAVLGAMGGAYLGMGTSQIGLMLGGPVGMALGAALGAVIGKTFIGKALGSVFGGKQTVEDTGFTVGKTDFASIFGGGLNAMQYADIKKDGGWFRSDKYSTKTEGLGEEGNRQISSVLMSLYDTVFEAGQMIGIGADGFAAQLNGFVVDIGKVSLKGLSDDEIQKELEAVFSKVGDDLAKFGVGGLEQFQKVGEGYLETLARVATNYQAVAVVTDSLGMTFGALGLASVGARERLIDLVGGLDEFTSGADQFLADFYTDQERANSLRARITPTLDQFGIKTGAEDSLQQFRSVVTGLDLTTEAGARAYAMLMQIAPAFKEIAGVDASIFEERVDLQKELDQLTLSAAQLLGQQRDALHESNRALFDQIQALKAQSNAAQSMREQASGLLGGVDSAFSVLQKVVGREKAALQDDIQARTEAVSKLRSLSDALRNSLNGIRTPEQQEEDRASAIAEVRAAAAIARAGGPLPDSDKLQKALAKIGSGPSTDGYATYQDYQRDLFGTQGDLAELARLTDDALTVEERSLKAVEDQAKQLGVMLEREQEQIDILKGISTTGLTIADAIRGLQGALAAARANPVVAAGAAINNAYQTHLGRAPEAAGMEYWQGAAAGGMPIEEIVSGIANSTEANLNKLYQEVLGRAPDAAGMDFFAKAYGATMDATEIADFIKSAKNSEEYQKLRGFAVGTNQVPYDMPAYIHKDERIIPAADNRELMRRLASPGGNADALAQEVARLAGVIEAQQRENAELRSALQDGLLAVATHTSNTASHLDDIVNGRRPVVTEAVPAPASATATAART